MGIISGFIGGAGDAAAKFGEMQMKKMMMDEKDEADFLRDKELAGIQHTYKAEDRSADQTFTTSERVAKQKDDSAEGVLDRKSKEVIADKSIIAAQTKATEKNPQLIKVPTKDGLEQQGIIRYDENNQAYVEIPPIKGQENSGQDIPITTADVEEANRRYDEKADILKSDKAQFGMSEQKYKDKLAGEIALERISKSKTTPKTAETPAAKPAAGNYSDIKDLPKDIPKQKMMMKGKEIGFPDYVRLVRAKMPDADMNQLMRSYERDLKISGSR